MSIYVEQYGGFWKLTSKQWFDIVLNALAGEPYNLDLYSTMLKRRPSCIADDGDGSYCTTNKHVLYKPLDWTIQEWVNEASEMAGLISDSRKHYMVEVAHNQYRSVVARGLYAKGVPAEAKGIFSLQFDGSHWTLSDQGGATVAFENSFSSIGSRFNIALLHRFH